MPKPYLPLAEMTAEQRAWQLKEYEDSLAILVADLQLKRCTKCGRTAAVMTSASKRALLQHRMEISERISMIRTAGSTESASEETLRLRRELEAVTSERDQLRERVAELEAAAVY